MSTHYLDKRNCQALLPPTEGLPVLERLEECLKGLNEQPGLYQGIIDKLIKHNKKTAKLSYGSQRYLPAAIDIAQGLDFETRVVRTHAYQRPGNTPVRLHLIFENTPNIGWKIILPLQPLLKKWGDANEGHQGYVHTICHNSPRLDSMEKFLNRQSTDKDDYYYVGITGRNWLQRLSEHMREVRNGGRRRFYRAWKASLDIEDVLIVSALMDINLSYNDAMNWEEVNVDRVAAGPNGLNMISGGFKGQRELHKLGLISKKRVSLEERERAIDELARQSPLKGVPNPFIAECWKDPEHYGKVIGARDKSLSVEQVHRIRELKQEGWAVKDIVKEVGALNAPQVYGVLRGDTYNKPPYT
jgi:hypothetical protein